MEKYDFKEYWNRLDNDKFYENIYNTPWYHDAVYEVFSPKEFKRRHDALRNVMSERGFDCLVVPGGQSNWSQGAGMTWLSGLVDTRSMAQYVVFPRHGEPLLVYGMGGAHVELMRRTVTPLCQVIVCSRGNYAEAMVQYIRELGLDQSRIGIMEAVPGEFPPQKQIQILLSGLPDAKIEFVSGLFHPLAYLKSEEEVEARARAGALAVAAFQAIVDRAAPGVTEHALSAAATKVILAGGGRVDSIALGSTPGSAPTLPAANPLPTGRRLENGDLILADISAGFMGTTAQIANPICVGKSSSAVNELWQVASAGFKHLERCLQPGTRLDEIAQAARFFRDRGYQSAPLILQGLDIAASTPRVYVQGCEAEEFEQTLKLGMVVALRPHVLAPQGEWGIAISRTYAITAEGNRCLTPYPVELIIASGRC